MNSFQKILLILGLMLCVRLPAFELKHYPLQEEPIDVVIPCHPRDASLLNLCIGGIRRNGILVRRVIVVSKEPCTPCAEWFPEDCFPFSQTQILDLLFNGDPEKITAYLSCENSRPGWILQQLIKLYAPFIIPNISSNVLVLDADTIFLRPTHFLNEHGGANFTIAKENHRPYFEHAKRLIPGFDKIVPNYSGVAHHMLFQRAILEDLFHVVESHHGIPMWQALCRCIDLNHLSNSPLSEYEIYFNFALANCSQVKARQLLWSNISTLNRIPSFEKRGFSYVSCHGCCQDEN